MKTIIGLLTILIFSSCAICKPPRNNAEMEQRVRKHDKRPFVVRQWITMRSDGYYLVHTTRGYRPTEVWAFECKPDSIQLEKLKDGKPPKDIL